MGDLFTMRVDMLSGSMWMLKLFCLGFEGKWGKKIFNSKMFKKINEKIK